MSINPARQVSVLWVAESNWTAQSGIKPHKHDYYHMFVVRQGPLEFVIGGEVHRLENGEALLAKPGVIHGMNEVTIRMGRVYEIKFTTQSPALKDLLEGMPSRLPADPFAGALVRELVAESGLQQPSTPTFVSDYLLALINFYSRHYGQLRECDTSTIDTTGFSKVSKQIVQYLEANCARELPLQEVADAVGFNKNYICSVFKRDSGMTIGGCQTTIRIRKAAEMISFSDMNLTQVATATGFTNLSHFNRIFKKVVGVPPGQYRRMFTGDILTKAGSEEAIQEIVGQNGFIVSVLGRKRLSISEIIDNFQEVAKSEADEQPQREEQERLE